MWKSSAGIYALKTSGEEEQRGLRLPLFCCGIIMMIKSQLQSYSKQWYAHSWGDSQSTGFPGSLFTLSHFWRRWCSGSLCRPAEMGNIAFCRERGNWVNSMRISRLATQDISLMAKHCWLELLAKLSFCVSSKCLPVPQWLVWVLRPRENRILRSCRGGLNKFICRIKH